MLGDRWGHGRASGNHRFCEMSVFVAGSSKKVFTVWQGYLVTNGSPLLPWEAIAFHISR